MNQRFHSSSKQRTSQRGYTLIEVLIAAVVMSIGLLGMAALQTVTLTKNHGSYVRSQANNLGYEILDAMRANVDDVDNYAGKTSVDECDPDFERGTTNIASDDFDEWANNLACLLPGGSGGITVVDASGRKEVTVTITWDDSHYEDQGETTDDPPTFTLKTIL